MIREKTIFRNMLFGAALLVAGASAVALSSCTEKEMSAEPVVDGSEVEICFTPSLGNGTATKGADVQPLGDSELFLTTIVSDNTSNPFADVMSRATSVTGFDPNGTDGTTYASFGVYSFLHDGSWAENGANATPYINGVEVVSLGNGIWGFEESVFWPAWDTNMTFFGYAPVGVVVGDGETVVTTPYIDFTDPAVTSTSLELDNQYDLLVAKTADVTKSASSVSMKFAHALTAVRFVCGEIDMVGTITKIGLSNVKYSGVYDMSAESWTLTNDAYNYEITTSVAVAGVDEDGEYTDKGSAILAGDATLMMLPQQLSGTVLTVEFTAEDGITVTSFTMELSTEWSAGTEVTYSISLADNRIDIIPYLNDENFKAYCIENYSSDGVHVWYPTETEGVTEMDFVNSTSSYTNITDFTGIYWFENLQRFTSKTAETLDLTQNLELSYIHLGGTDATTDPGAPIDTLDLSKNTKMTEIYTAAFAYCSKLTSITFPSTLTTIDFDAFEYCTALTSVDIPASVTEIRGDAFEGCTSLTTATFNTTGGVILDGRVFAECTALETVVNSEYVLFSGNSSANFQKCSSLTSFKLNASITALESYEFESSGLTTLDGINQLISIGDYALEYTHLTSAALHENMTTIGDYAFAHISELAEVITLPSTLTSLGEFAFAWSGITSVVITAADMTDGKPNFTIANSASAFANCESLTTVSLPDGWTEIGPYWFSNCSALTSITLPSTITTIDQSAFASSGLTSIDLPDSLSTMGTYVFNNCKSLTEMTIPSKITSLPDYTFQNCNYLVYVDLPAGIISIGNNAFNGCNRLATTILRATSVPEVGGSNTFNWGTSITQATKTLYVPDSSVDAYIAAWGASGTVTNVAGKFDVITAIEDDSATPEP